MDMYDNMLDSIQQFPLDANCFERRIRRINKTYDRYYGLYTRLLKRIPLPSYRPLLTIKKKLEKCIKRKKRFIVKFMECIDRQLTNMEEYNKMESNKIHIGKLEPVGCAVARISDNEVLDKRVCLCNSLEGGTLVQCGSPRCKVGWYHCRCVYLNSVPRDEWICDACKRTSCL